jgi:hypothetical protein
MIFVVVGTDVSKFAVGRVILIGIGVGVGVDVGCGVAVGARVGVGVAVGVGVGVCVGVGGGGLAVGVALGVCVGVGPTTIIVIAPLFWLGTVVLSWSSINSKSSGDGFQFSGLIGPGVLLTRRMIRLNSVPDPLSGMKSSEKADIRRILTEPGPLLIMLPETFQLLAVTPAG